MVLSCSQQTPGNCNGKKLVEMYGYPVFCDFNPSRKRKSPNSRPFPRHRIAAPKSTCSFTATIQVLRKLYSFYYSLINLWKNKLPSLAITSFAGGPCVCETWGGRIHYSLWPRLPGNSLGFSLDGKVKARSSFTRAALQ